MEFKFTIFDLDISNPEIDILGIRLNKENYLKASNSIKKLYDVYRLLRFRGDIANARMIIEFMMNAT